MPFSLIKSISINVCNYILEERKNGEFKDFYNFMIRCYNQIVNKKIVISLLECGAFNIFGINKKAYVNNIDEIINYVSLCKNLSLVIDEKPAFDEKIKDYTDSEIIDNEIKNYGFYLSFHPITKYDRSNLVKLNDYKKYFNKIISILLYVEEVKTIKTKNGTKMSFLTLSDEYDSVEGVIFPQEYIKIGELEKNKIYLFNAKIERRNSEYQLIIFDIKKV
jgi:DNA polymerase-3 subunit alpha